MTWDGLLGEELERSLTPCEDEQEQLRRFARFMAWERGTEASEALSATDFRVRRFHQLREEAFHRIGLVLEEYQAVLRKGERLMAAIEDIPDHATLTAFWSYQIPEDVVEGDERDLTGITVADLRWGGS